MSPVMTRTRKRLCNASAQVHDTNEDDTCSANDETAHAVKKACCNDVTRNSNTITVPATGFLRRSKRRKVSISMQNVHHHRHTTGNAQRKETARKSSANNTTTANIPLPVPIDIQTTRSATKSKPETKASFVTPSPHPPFKRHSHRRTGSTDNGNRSTNSHSSIQSELYSASSSHGSLCRSSHAQNSTNIQDAFIPSIFCPFITDPKHNTCGCSFHVNHNDSRILTESYLASYGHDYHSAILHNETQPIPSTISGNYASSSQFSSPYSSQSSKSSSYSMSPNKPLPVRRSQRIQNLMHKQQQDTQQQPFSPPPPSSSSSSSLSTVLYLPFELQMNYMHRHKDLTPRTRAVLVDWLIDVAAEFSLDTMTLSTAVGLVDRCLAICQFTSKVDLNRKGRSKRYSYDSSDNSDDDSIDDGDFNNCKSYSSNDAFIVGKNTLQLLGCGCMMIASKLHDTKPMKADRFTYLSADSFSEEQIIDMEQRICSAMRFRLNIVTPYHFIDRVLRASYVSSECSSSLPPCSFAWQGEDRLRYMVNYLLEISMLEFDFVPMKPSLVAAGAIYLARAILGIREKQQHDIDKCEDEVDKLVMKQHDERYGYYFSRALEHYSGYSVKEIVPVVLLLCRAHKRSSCTVSSMISAHDKYSSSSFKCVALNASLKENQLFPASVLENANVGASFLDSDYQSLDDSSVEILPATQYDSSH